MAVYRNPIQVVERTVGNVEPIGFDLQDIDGNPSNMSGQIVSAKLVDMGNNQTLSTVPAAMSDPANGRGSFEPGLSDVDTPRRIAVYIMDDTSPERQWPYDGARFQIHVKKALAE